MEAAKKAAKAASVKCDPEFVADFMMDPANRTREVEIPAVEAQTVRLADLARQNPAGKVKLNPAEISESLTEFNRVIRDAIRQVSETAED
jgi:hypothetical protein